MSDVRALLKAKREEIRINHPLSTYSSSGQLRCLACGTAVKHASAWEGHLGSKVHRTNVARIREEQRQAELEEQEKAHEQPENKRSVDVALDSGREVKEPKRRKLAPDVANEPDDQPSQTSLPSGFFSDPSRSLSLSPSDDPINRGDPAASNDSLDAEWAVFQQTVLNAPDDREAYERATIVADAQLAPEHAVDGFPQQPEEVSDQVPTKMNEEEERRQKEQDERELIMDRLLDEERAQEEADMKVTVLKERLDALKRRREAAKPNRPTATVGGSAR